MHAVAGDFTGDGFVDIYVVNEGAPNVLYKAKTKPKPFPETGKDFDGFEFVTALPEGSNRPYLTPIGGRKPRRRHPRFDRKALFERLYLNRCALAPARGASGLTPVRSLPLAVGNSQRNPAGVRTPRRHRQIGRAHV